MATITIDKRGRIKEIQPKSKPSSKHRKRTRVKKDPLLEKLRSVLSSQILPPEMAGKMPPRVLEQLIKEDLAEAKARYLEEKQQASQRSLAPETFDGQVISVIDVPLTEGGSIPLLNRNTYFFNPANGSYVPFNYWCDAVIHKARITFESDWHFRHYGFPINARREGYAWLRRYREEDLLGAKKVSEFHGGILKGLVPVLREGRLKVSLLVNSPGGDVGLLRILEALLYDIQARGGHVDAYVDTKAFSAAARLFLRADRRFAHPGSTMLIHGGYDAASGHESEFGSYSSFDSTIGLLLDASTPDFSSYDYYGHLWEHIFSKMRENSHPLFSDDVAASLARPSDVDFSASELRQFGIAEVLPDVDALMAMFFSETGISPEYIAEQMRLIHLLKRPGFKEKPARIDPVAQFYINALEREGSI
ncbi:MAG: hypothetical protein QXH30_03740 [Candidatus Bilamarchaeaceae archaeon]